MTTACTHPLCAIIGGACSLAASRSRGCHPSLASTEVAPELLAEVRRLLGELARAPDARGEPARAVAIRLAALVRREALDGRSLLAIVRAEEPDLAPALAQLCRTTM